MRRGLFLLILLVVWWAPGCASRKEDDAAPPNAPINNSAPEAKNAPPAPIDPRSDPRGGKAKRP